MNRLKTRLLTLVIAVSLVLMLMMPLLVQGFNNPLLNAGQLALTFQAGFGGTAQTTMVGTLMVTATS